MANKTKDKIFQDAKKYIPLKVFQMIIPSIDKKIKKPYIELLLEENPNKLKNLTAYWEINRSKDFFLFQLDKTQGLDKKKIILNKTFKLVDDEPFYEIKSFQYDEEKNDYYLKIKVRLPQKEFKSEHCKPPFSKIKIKHRKPYLMNLIFHGNETIVECRSRSRKQAMECTEFFILEAFDEKINYEQIFISNIKLLSAGQNSKCKKAIIKGEWFGAEQITIEGEDTLRWIDFLKEKNIDLAKNGLEIFECTRESVDLPISCNLENGKISIRSIKEGVNPYIYLKELRLL